MGFFERILGGGAGGSPPPWMPNLGAPAGDSGAGKPLDSFEIERGPFPRQFRLRASYPDYALVGGWVVVTMNSAADWSAAREQVLQAYYKQFGLYNLPDGSQTIRWNEETWRAVRDALQILYDPRFGGGLAP